jgi:hypothetical protein
VISTVAIFHSQLQARMVVLSVIGDTVKLLEGVKLVHSYFKDFKDAPRESAEFFEEAEQLSSVLHRLSGVIIEKTSPQPPKLPIPKGDVPNSDSSSNLVGNVGRKRGFGKWVKQHIFRQRRSSTGSYSYNTCFCVITYF